MKGIIFTSKLTPHVLTCYKNKTCHKIYLLSTASGYTSTIANIGELKNEVESKAKEFKINLNDIVIVPHPIVEAYETILILNKYFVKNNIKSAILFLPYYETEKFHFYFKRFLNPGITLQIKPLESKYRHLLEQWASNTGLSNIYLDQYLIIAHYYFNKILWSPIRQTVP